MYDVKVQLLVKMLWFKKNFLNTYLISETQKLRVDLLSSYAPKNLGVWLAQIWSLIGLLKALSSWVFSISKDGDSWGPVPGLNHP